jgi:hypothetical protein
LTDRWNPVFLRTAISLDSNPEAVPEEAQDRILEDGRSVRQNHVSNSDQNHVWSVCNLGLAITLRTSREETPPNKHRASTPVRTSTWTPRIVRLSWLTARRSIILSTLLSRLTSFCRPESHDKQDLVVIRARRDEGVSKWPNPHVACMLEAFPRGNRVVYLGTVHPKFRKERES